MENDKFVICYETLFELLRLERSRTELQEVPAAFLDDVKGLIDSDINEISSLEDESEKQKNRIHLDNMLKIVNEIYERREKKIVNMAVNKSKTKSAIIDFSRFLEHENELFHQIVGVLDKYRGEMTDDVLSRGNEKEKDVRRDFSDASDSTLDADAGYEKKDIEEKQDIEGGKGGALESPEEGGSEKEEVQPVKEKAIRTVRFISPIPTFMGPDLEEYGPFEEEDIASLPSKIVNILVEKNRAEEIVVED
ncbi:MAG: hypothetical protein KAK00_04215 [Nanoarchaeota archaeon]|nr:hypothetical protein [Nanoarchaeota archaeon]